MKARGLDRVLKQIGGFGKQKIAKVKTEVLAAAYEANYNQKNDAAVDTGELRRNINVEISQDGLSAKLSSNAPHSAYVEFGTGGKVEIPSELKDIAAKYQGAGIREVNLPARPFFFANAEKAFRNLMVEIKKIL